MSPRLLIVLALLPLLSVAVAAGGLILAVRRTEALVASRIVAPAKTVTIDLRPAVYAGLPAPVRRYFDFAFNGQAEVTLRAVDWTEQGEFLLPVGRFHVQGRQRSQAREPVYAWTGRFHRLGLPLIESRDAFFGDAHEMRARLLGLLRLMHTDYDDPTERAALHSYLLLRYYGQAPLMPWALLPNPHVAWRARDDESAWLEITRAGLAGRYLVTLGADGRIAQMATDRLLIEGNHVWQREVGLKLDYAERNGFRIPQRMEYRWYLEDGALSSHYAFRLIGFDIIKE